MQWIGKIPWFSQYPLENLLVVSAFIFCCGLYTVLTRKNAIAILMGIELLLNSANINLVAFARFGNADIDGTVFVLFIILVAAAEAAVALAIVVGIYQNFGRIDAEDITEMKE
jgi:NADH-quinone oxidoreductase subunit K